MNQLEELQAQKEKLRERMKQYQDAAKKAHGQDRAMLNEKVRVYRASIADLQVQIDYLDPPKERKARKVTHKILHVDQFQFDFFERCGTVWSDIDGYSWEQIEDGDPIELDASMQQLQVWMAEGSERLTDRQRLYLDAYYNEGFSMEHIAQIHNVSRSTVARVIQNGLKRMQDWVESKRLIASHVDGNGGFDWVGYLPKVTVLTDRQKQLLLLIVSKYPKDQIDLSAKLGVDPSTISRTVSKAETIIRKLGASGRPTHALHLRDWNTSDKYSLAIETGMPVNFYYKYCFYGQHVGGLTRYMYEIARRREAGVKPKEVAAEFGLKERTVRQTYGKLKRQNVHVGNAVPPMSDTIGARLDPETYVKLQRLVTSNAGP